MNTDINLQLTGKISLKFAFLLIYNYKFVTFGNQNAEILIQINIFANNTSISKSVKLIKILFPLKVFEQYQ